MFPPNLPEFLQTRGCGGRSMGWRRFAERGSSTGVYSSRSQKTALQSTTCWARQTIARYVPRKHSRPRPIFVDCRWHRGALATNGAVQVRDFNWLMHYEGQQQLRIK